MFLSTYVEVQLWRSQNNVMEYTHPSMGPSTKLRLPGGKAGTLAAECLSGSGPRLLGSFLGPLFPACGGLGSSVLHTLSGQCCRLETSQPGAFLLSVTLHTLTYLYSYISL